jgi:hypothetical protein
MAEAGLPHDGVAETAKSIGSPLEGEQGVRPPGQWVVGMTNKSLDAHERDA